MHIITTVLERTALLEDRGNPPENREQQKRLRVYRLRPKKMLALSQHWVFWAVHCLSVLYTLSSHVRQPLMNRAKSLIPLTSRIGKGPRARRA